MKQFQNKTSRRIVVNSDGIIKEIKIDDIICFYSDKKYNYCRTKEKSYKIKSKLYEIEKMDPNFIRISKACIVNSKHIKFFNLNETGRIVVVFNDDSEEMMVMIPIDDNDNLFSISKKISEKCLPLQCFNKQRLFYIF